MIERLRVVQEIGRLRRSGFAVAWNVDLRMSPGYTVLGYGTGCTMGRGGLLHLEFGGLEMGDTVRFGPFNYVTAVDSRIKIGSRLLCAPFVSLVGSNHATGDDGRPSLAHDPLKAGITIGDDCWLATNSVILPGVTLGDRCVVAAGAVVTRSFPDGSRVAGVPARAI